MARVVTREPASLGSRPEHESFALPGTGPAISAPALTATGGQGSAGPRGRAGRRAGHHGRTVASRAGRAAPYRGQADARDRAGAFRSRAVMPARVARWRVRPPAGP